MNAQVIRKARELTGESQTVFCARFGVDQSTYSRWETLGPPPRGPGRRLLEREVAEIYRANGIALDAGQEDEAGGQT